MSVEGKEESVRALFQSFCLLNLVHAFSLVHDEWIPSTSMSVPIATESLVNRVLGSAYTYHRIHARKSAECPVL